MPAHSFANSFWDTDFNGTDGYERILHRSKDGRKLYDAFAEFVKYRAKFEEEYGRNLIKLATLDTGSEEVGSLKTSWETVKKETENIGLIHIQLSKELNELSERSIRFRDQQKLERQKNDDSIRQKQKEKRASFDTMAKAKRFYEQRCKEYDSAKKAYDDKSSYTPKEEEKLKKNMQKCKTSLESADSTYQSSITTLDSQRKKYINSFEDTCNRFQVIEEGRIQFLRNELWLYSNYGSTHAVNVDQKYEQCRNSLEKCHVKQDLELFITTKHTGSTRPSRIEYENYYNDQLVVARGWPANNHHRNVLNPSSLVIADKYASNPNLAGTGNHSSTNSNSSNEQLSSSRHTSNYLANQQLYSSSNPNLLNTSEDAYASVSELYRPMSTSRKIAISLYRYEAQNNQELNLEIDDVIEVLYIVDETWGMGVAHGKKGAFPLTFVELS